MFLLDGFCTDTATIWQVLGRVLNIVKIVIPLLIVIFGMIDLGKSVIASKPEEISKSAKSLMFRIIAGIVVFFVPTLVAAVFTIVDSFKAIENDYDVCATCIRNPNECNTSNAK